VAAAAHVVREQRSAIRGIKGAIVQIYTDPPPSSTVICLDERGPVAARSYPGPSWSDGAHRPHFHPAYACYVEPPEPIGYDLEVHQHHVNGEYRPLKKDQLERKLIRLPTP